MKALSERQRAVLKSRIRREILRQTTHAPALTAELARATQGCDPWDTRCAPGHDYNEAVRRDGVVS